MKIKIRHAEKEDANVLRQIYSMPGVIEGTLQIPFPSSRIWEERTSNLPANITALVAEYENAVRGNLGLWIENSFPRRRHTAGIGMAVHDEFLRKGIGSALLEAALDLTDNWLNIIRVELTVFTDNEAAIKLYEKFGFEKEGTLKKYAFKSGQFSDAYSMARVK